MTDLLFLAHRIPYPPNKGDKLRSYHLLKHLSRYYQVRLGCFIDDQDDWQHVDTLREICVETFFVPLRPWVSKLRSLNAVVRGNSLSLHYYRNASLSRWVQSIVTRGSIDRALIFSSVMAQYIDGITGLHRVADFVDVDSSKWAAYAEEARWPSSWIYAREAKTLLAFERKVADEFDATVFVSKAEADLFRKLAPSAAQRVWHAGNGVDIGYFDPAFQCSSPYPDATRVLAFTGAMDYKPNIDAVSWFAQEAFPAILDQWPDARFAIVGSRPSATVRKLQEQRGIIVTGTVPDMRPYLAHAAVVVAPLRIARGVQNKVLEGMAMGRTVIASREAAQGIEAAPGREILIADTAQEYISVVASVFQGVCDVGQSARKRIFESYSWVANLDKIRELLEGPSPASGKIGSHAAAAA